MASPTTPYTAIALNDDDPQHDSDLFINDEFPVGEDDDDLSLDGLEENDDNPPHYTGVTLCVVCRKRPPYSRRGKSYPTCGFTCAARLQSSSSQRGAYHGRGESSSSRGGSPAQGTVVATSSTLRDQNPPVPTINPAIGHLFQYLGGHKQQSTLDSQSDERDDALTSAQMPAPPTLLCVICLVKPCYSSEYVTCGLTCAETLCKVGSNPNMCNYCHRQLKLTGQNQCSKLCSDGAKLACLLCKSRPKFGRYQLCGRTCKQIAVKLTPLILEAPPGHTTYELVEQKFKTAWQVNTSQCPPIKKIFKIIENKSFLLPYDRYKKRVGPASEVFRYHGTARRCTLGNAGNTQLCGSTACPLCSILRTSFKVSLASPSGAFGPGVYTSSASNKSYSYTRSGTGAIILTKVVLGKVRSVSAWNEVMTCPPGFNSVVFDQQNGTLNETIVYSDDAIRPVFLLLF